jgi:hypothetical protein
MQRQTYDAASLERVVGGLERHYGLSTAELLEARSRGDAVAVPGFQLAVWISCHADLVRLRGEGGFAEQAQRLLTPVC